MDSALAPGGSQAKDVPIVKMLQVGYVIEAECGVEVEYMDKSVYVFEVAYGVGALVAAYIRCWRGDYRQEHRIDVEDWMM